MEKKCSNCLEIKSLQSYYNKKNGLHGKHAECKNCLCMKNKIWKEKNPEKVKINNENYYEKLNSQYKTSAFRGHAKQIGNTLEGFNRYAQRKMKNLAASLINYGLRCGYIIRKTECEKCGEKGIIEGHHSDYSKPLEVVWVCIECHAKLHTRM